jgi:hypothetical protein
MVQRGRRVLEDGEVSEQDEPGRTDGDGLMAGVRLNIVRVTDGPFTGLSSAISGITASMTSSIKPLLISLNRAPRPLLGLNFDKQAWSEMFRPLLEALPANWPDDPDWTAAMEIMNDGIPLIWVPRCGIVVQLMRAPDDPARRDLLVRFRSEIAEDCLDVLSEVGAAALLPLAGLAGDACRALAAGHCAASQALAANVFDTWLRDAARRGVVLTLPASGWFYYDKVRRQIEPLTGKVTMRRLRAAGALAPAHMALAEFRGGTVPAQFGRHATAHAAGPEQYTDVNAVIAVMLTASVLRQAQASGW